MPSEFVKVYDLREAPHNIAEVERTLNFRRSEGHKEVLIPAQLTPGSPGWWEAMESGLIRVYTAEGVITAIYDVGAAGWGTFTTPSTWTKGTARAPGTCCPIRVGMSCTAREIRCE